MSGMFWPVFALAVGIGSAAAGQTIGTWTVTGDEIQLVPADGSGRIVFACDDSGSNVVMTTYRGTNSDPFWITVRAENGFAYAVPVSVTNTGLEMTGGLRGNLLDPSGIPAAGSITVTTPPSPRPPILADMVPEVIDLFSRCRG